MWSRPSGVLLARFWFPFSSTTRLMGAAWGVAGVRALRVRRRLRVRGRAARTQSGSSRAGAGLTSGWHSCGDRACWGGVADRAVVTRTTVLEHTHGARPSNPPLPQPHNTPPFVSAWHRATLGAGHAALWYRSYAWMSPSWCHAPTHALDEGTWSISIRARFSLYKSFPVS